MVSSIHSLFFKRCLVTTVALLLWGLPASAYASCGSGQCNLSSQSGGKGGLQAGHWLIDLSQTYLTVNKPLQYSDGVKSGILT
ncbi:MAG: hypothetical protein Q9M12_03345 [Mariprofundus sp.]|nr:hypothetical protein [Mariprofundus sp.]